MIGPVPPFNDPPVNPQYYEPSNFYISSVSQSATPTVVTTENHDYVTGQLVRFNIPAACGMFQLNQKQAYVVTVPTATSFTIDLSTVLFDSFLSISFPPNRTQPQVSAIGDRNTATPTSTGRVLTSLAIPGSFINVSNTVGING